MSHLDAGRGVGVMKVVVLAGGLGTRLSEETALVPKPMVEIGARPILWHLFQIFSAQGLNEFVVALGYKGDVIKDYFRNFTERNSDLKVDLSRGFTEIHGGIVPSWTVELIDTGEGTETGGRVRRVRSHLTDTFMLTYGDGLADIDLSALLAFHRSHGRLATVTAVRPPARFGGLRIEDDRVAEFTEKPQASEGWINGGFFVLEPGVIDYIAGDDTIWERAPLEQLAADGQLMAYRHEGFWQPMDTLREKRLLESMWNEGRAPWKVWK